MSEENAQKSKKALVPVEERTVDFYDDEIPVAIVEHGEVYVPLRPLCDYLGVNYRSQRRRVTRDPVLSEYVVDVTISTAGGTQAASCIPLDFLNGWLFGISAASVNENIRDRVVRYQRECYRVLRDAFQGKQPIESTQRSALMQVREMGRAIMQMAEEQMEFDRRLITTETRMDKAANIVGDLTKRVDSIEQQLTQGDAVTEDQASQISQAVKTVAITLGKQTKRNEFGAVYGEMYRKFGVTSYKLLPAGKFEEAMAWLSEWHQSIVGDEPF